MVSKRRISVALSLLMIAIITLMSGLAPGHCQLLGITVVSRSLSTLVTNQTLYTYRTMVQVNGNLTMSGTLVNGLVGIEVNSLNASYAYAYAHMVARTVGSLPPNMGFNVTIASVIPMNINGTPTASFTRGTTARVNVTVINHNLYERPVLITVLAEDCDSTPITPQVMSFFQTPLVGGGNISFSPEFYIDTWVSPGRATLYADVFSNWPSNGGFPYAPEKTANFTVLSGGAPASTISSQQTEAAGASAIQSTGAYTVSFRLPPYAPQGPYSINATGWYEEFSANASTEFTLARQMLGDVKFEHQINILDAVAITSAYGASSRSANWNPQLDVSPDGVINILDVVIVTSRYGKKY